MCIRMLLLAWFILVAVRCAAQVVPAERTAVFPAAKAADLIKTVCYQPPDGLTGYWTPETKDLQGVEDNLVAYLKSIRVNGQRDWTNFRRQVTGAKRGDETLLFISYYFFHPSHDAQAKETLRGYDPDAWKRTPYRVFDGGESVFRVLYDITRKQFIWYERNGSG